MCGRSGSCSIKDIPYDIPAGRGEVTPSEIEFSGGIEFSWGRSKVIFQDELKNMLRRDTQPSTKKVCAQGSTLKGIISLWYTGDRLSPTKIFKSGAATHFLETWSACIILTCIFQPINVLTTHHPATRTTHQALRTPSSSQSSLPHAIAAVERLDWGHPCKHWRSARILCPSMLRMLSKWKMDDPFWMVHCHKTLLYGSWLCIPMSATGQNCGCHWNCCLRLWMGLGLLGLFGIVSGCFGLSWLFVMLGLLRFLGLLWCSCHPCHNGCCCCCCRNGCCCCCCCCCKHLSSHIAFIGCFSACLCWRSMHVFCSTHGPCQGHFPISKEETSGIWMAIPRALSGKQMSETKRLQSLNFLLL